MCTSEEKAELTPGLLERDEYELKTGQLTAKIVHLSLFDRASRVKVMFVTLENKAN